MIEGLSGAFRQHRRGGVPQPGVGGGAGQRSAVAWLEGPRGGRPLQLERYDSKGQNEEALSALRAAIDDGAQFVLQGNSSANAAALIDAINKHNEREPARRVLFLNYSAVDPILTNEKCSFWHFRFDAHADMRMAALMEVLRTTRRSVGLPDRAGLQLWPGRAARGAPPAGRAAPRRGRSWATSCTRWAA
jgi:branched-chain amino acid transport system substrate-binding protein